MSDDDLSVHPLRGLPEVRSGDDLAGLLVGALDADGSGWRDGDVLVVSSKVVSKAAGLRVSDGSRVALVLSQARRVVAERMGAEGVVRIVETTAGPVMAAAGIDASNTGPDGGVLLLPQDPDGAARELRAGIIEQWRLRGHSGQARLGFVLSDTSGRPWREGLTDFALGVAGLPPLDDHRGGVDADGRPLSVTVRAVADELAAAADLVRGKDRGVPAALIRGLPWPDGVRNQSAEHPGAAALVRTGPTDWFALGHAEAVRAALGVAPGTAEAVAAGIRPVAPDDVDSRIARAVAVATTPDGLGRVPAQHPRARLVGPLPDLSAVRVDVLQYGLRVEAPDHFALGLVSARLIAALAGEDIHVALTRTDPPERPGRGERALLVFLDLP